MKQRKGKGKGGSGAQKGTVEPNSANDKAKDRKSVPGWAFIKLTGSPSYDMAVSAAAVLVLVCLVAELTSNTAYGRFGNSSTIAMSPRLGWFLMELPCSMVFIYQFFVVGGPQSRETVPRIMAVIFCVHYLYRGWYFPYSIKVHKNSKNFSVVPALFSWVITATHAYLNARWFAEHGKHLNTTWLRKPAFWVGLLLYYSGFFLIIQHDAILTGLRPCPGGSRYCIPRGGLFNYATCAQYFVELWAWTGFTLLSCGPNGLFILGVSLANLIPRAAATHAWYLDKFGQEYQELGRNKLVPGVW